jgi:long-chain acyl-CoA synthetase
MLGYWNDEARTRETLEGGWLRTGDAGGLRDGEVVVRGRLKEILVLANGENVAPASVEAAIAQDPLFAQVLIVGDGSRRLRAVIVPEPAGWRGFAEGLGLDPQDPATLANPAVRKAALERARRRLGAFPRHAWPAQVVLAIEPWTVENGLMTPTRKLKRRALERRFAAELGRAGAPEAAAP